MDSSVVTTTACKLLVKAITGFHEKEENFQRCLSFTVSNLINHNYVDPNIFAVKQKISRLREKFQIQSEIKKVKSFFETTEKIFNTIEEKPVLKKNEFVRILSFLLEMAESQPEEITGEKQVLSCGAAESPPFDWASYLREDDVVCKFSSSSDEYSLSECSEPDEGDEPDTVPDSPLRPPARDDSGLGVSPDSCAGSTHQHFRGTPPGGAGRRPDTFYPYWETRWQRTCDTATNGISPTDNLYSLIERKVVVHERNVIKEVLWMMFGVKKLFVVLWDGHKYVPNSQVHLVGLTSHTLDVVLGEFCGHATRLVHLREQLHEVNRPDNPCRTVQAYACAMLDAFQEVQEGLARRDAELRAAGGVVTLLSFREDLRSLLHDADLLHVLHSEACAALSGVEDPCERACALTRALRTLLGRQSVQEEESNTLQVILRVFLRTCRPYFGYLEELLVLGSFEDPQGEFIVRRESVPPESEEFWARGFTLRSPGRDADSFLGPFLPDILCAAASFEVLRKAGALSDHADPKGELYLRFLRIFRRLISAVGVEGKEVVAEVEERAVGSDPLLESVPFPLEGQTAHFFRPEVNPAYESVHLGEPETILADQHRKTERSLSRLQPSRLGPLLPRLDRAIRVCVASACLPVSRRLVQSLKSDSNVDTHLAVMKKYFLMESGDLMHSFLSDVFHKISVREPWLDVFFLNSTLRNAIIDDKDTFEKLTVAVDFEAAESNSPQPLTKLGAMRLCYKVEWPVSIVLGPRVQSEYSDVFLFLVQVKCAKYLLDNLHFTSPCGGPTPDPLTRVLRRSVHPREQKAHGMRIVRMRLMFFVNGLHAYLLGRVPDCAEEDLSGAGTAADMLSAHRRHLRSLRERCLLDRRIAYLRDQILQVLHLCFAFQQLWAKGVDRVSREELFEIESQFSKMHCILLCCFNTPLKRGTHVHLEHLVHSMLSDSHSHHLFKT